MHLFELTFLAFFYLTSTDAATAEAEAAASIRFFLLSSSSAVDGNRGEVNQAEVSEDRFFALHFVVLTFLASMFLLPQTRRRRRQKRQRRRFELNFFFLRRRWMGIEARRGESSGGK